MSIEEQSGREEDARASLLIGRMAMGDERALDELYAQFGAVLFGLLLRMLRDRGAAEEVLQDVFVKAFAKAADYSMAEGRPYTWLVTIARRKAIDALRRRRDVHFPLEGGEQVAVAADTATMDGQADTQIAHDFDSLLPLLQGLGSPRRELLELAYLGGFSQRELAGKFGLPLGTVKSELRRGMMELRQKFLRRHDG
jgi:RNA polymerase sigma-70 factor (ECF subfamily)